MPNYEVRRQVTIERKKEPEGFTAGQLLVLFFIIAFILSLVER